VTHLKEGAGIVTTRAHVHYVVTEHGIAYLNGKPIRERVKALIKIAAPEHRENLTKEAWEYFK
jgi:acyl-CoA hydrolase